MWTCCHRGPMIDYLRVSLPRWDNGFRRTSSRWRYCRSKLSNRCSDELVKDRSSNPEQMSRVSWIFTWELTVHR
jgi:hypothetical protein